MGILEILGLAGSISLLAGWRLYLCVLVTGIAMRTGYIDLPQHLQALDALANPWVIGVAGIGTIAEFFADKIAWLDSAWDAVHTFIRPFGGALLSLAIVDAADPTWQVIAFLLGGGAALVSHGGKASARAVVNASPEPVSNVVVSTAEDIVTGGMLALVIANPLIAGAIALVLLAFALWLLFAARRLIRKLFRPKRPPEAPPV